MQAAKNYLHQELDCLVQSDPSTWEFLQQGSLDGVWYWDLENPEHEWMSPELWRTLGVDPATKAHDPAEWQDLIYPEDLKLAMENFDAHCADPDHPYDQVVRYRHADGSTVWIRCRGLAIRNEAGAPIRMLGAHTDITAVKRSEEDARAGWRAAEAANAELRSFAYSISHDLKAPANTLHLLLDEFGTHMKDKLDAEGQDMHTMCVQTVHRMQSLIEYVLEYTRVIGTEPKMEPMDLIEAAEYAQRNLRADIAARGAKITIGALPRIVASRPQMNLFFQNLLSNAIKYCPRDRTPEITIAQAEAELPDGIEIAFADNGIGVPPEAHERIFALFQRLHSHDEIEGHGLGLPMCQRIAMHHQGTLRVTSEGGAGAVFSLHLPRSILA